MAEFNISTEGMRRTTFAWKTAAGNPGATDGPATFEVLGAEGSVLLTEADGVTPLPPHVVFIASGTTIGIDTIVRGTVLSLGNTVVQDVTIHQTAAPAVGADVTAEAEVPKP